MSNYRSLKGKTGKLRRELFNGVEHLVVPVVALVEGVIAASNASGPELVLASEFGHAPQGWNGRPVMAGHPQKNGTMLSAGDPKTLETSQIGLTFGAKMKDRALHLEAWIDEKKALSLGGDAADVVQRLNAGETVEVSVGTFVDVDEKSGDYQGSSYDGAWHHVIPDHLAFLKDGEKGACSIDMGCGAQRAASELKTSGGEGSGNFGHEGRPGEVGGSGPGDGAAVQPTGRSKKIVNAILDPATKPWDRRYIRNFPEGKRDDVVKLFSEVKATFEAQGFQLSHSEGTLLGSKQSVRVSHGTKGTFEIRRYYLGVIPGDFAKGYRGVHKFQIEEIQQPKTAGGEGSGNFGHSGRPGEQGGSGPGGGGETKGGPGSYTVPKKGGGYDVKYAPGFGPNATPAEKAHVERVRKAFEKVAPKPIDARNRSTVDVAHEILATGSMAVKAEVQSAAKAEKLAVEVGALLKDRGFTYSEKTYAKGNATYSRGDEKNDIVVSTKEGPRNPSRRERVPLYYVVEVSKPYGGAIRDLSGIARTEERKMNEQLFKSLMGRVRSLLHLQDEDAEKIEVEVRAELTAAQETISNEGEQSMCKTERIKTLIASKKFTEAQRPILEACSDEVLEEFEGIEIDAVEDTKVVEETPKAEEKVTVASQKPLTTDEYIAAAPPELQETLREGLRSATDKRNGMIKALIDTKRCSFTEGELKAKSLDELKKLTTLAATPVVEDYSARALASEASDSEDIYNNPPDGYRAALEALAKVN